MQINLNIILYVCTLSLVSGYALIRFVSRYFFAKNTNTQLKTTKRMFLFASCHFLSFVVLLLGSLLFPARSSLLLLVCIAVWFFLSRLFLQAPLAENYFYYFLYSISCFSLQALMLAIVDFEQTISMFGISILILILCFFVYCASCLALSYLIFTRKMLVQKEAPTFRIITLSLALCFILFHFVMPLYATVFPPETCRILVLLSGLVLGILTYHAWKKKCILQEILRLQQLGQNYQYYYTALLNHEKELYVLHHDLANHLRTLQIMANQGHNVKEYTETLLKKYGNVSTLCLSNNMVIDSILCEKQDIIEQYSIQFRFSGDFASMKSYTDAHLAALYASLLDYIAIKLQNTSCEKILFTSSYAKEELCLQLNFPPSKNKPKSTENPQEEWELSLAKDIVQKYAGSFSSEVQGSMQHVVLRLPHAKTS